MDKISKLSMLSLILVAVCVISRPADADTSIYVFDPNKSTVIQTGGFAGVHETYTVTGQFRLSVDSDAGIASFEMVDANLTEPSGFLYTRQSLGVLFNMTGLSGTVVDDKTIEFEGKTTDSTESDVNLKLSFSDDSAHLTGQITPPPNSADMFFYDIDAVAAKKYAGGAGEPNDPYQIATAEDLILLGETPDDYDKHFILTADIDLDPNLPGRKVFDKAVIAPDVDPGDQERFGPLFYGTPFTGVFDGNGHRLSHLTVKGIGYRYLGLFGQLSGEVKNLGVIDVNITGSTSFIGGLMGENGGTVIECYSTGVVEGDGTVGGLLGMNYSGTVSQCHSTCTVSGSNSVGGLVGKNQSTITNCYAAGNVSANEDFGGLAGRDEGSIEASFWDIQISELTTSAGGIGLTTAEMQTQSTFTNAGWDFVDESANGTEDIWSICEGTNYPRLVWQIPAGDFVCPDGITIDDFLFFMEHWLDDNCDLSNDYCQGTDLDRSGTVDVNDLEIFFENWSAEK